MRRRQNLRMKIKKFEFSSNDSNVLESEVIISCILIYQSN